MDAQGGCGSLGGSRVLGAEHPPRRPLFPILQLRGWRLRIPRPRIESRGELDGNNPAHHLDFAVDRCPSHLALQFGLGVLSQRRIGPDPDYPVDPVADGAVLKFWALAGTPMSHAIYRTARTTNESRVLWHRPA